jgi:peptidoglycan/xylan/chitin deacetylase (PgdA/CDA1 family)
LIKNLVKTRSFYALILIALLLGTPVLSFAQQSTGSIEVDLKYQNGDRINALDSATLKIYQDSTTTIYKEITSITSNPYAITSLPIGHKYKIEEYINSMYAGVGILNLQKSQDKLDITTPSPGGIRITAYYSDAATPILGAIVSIKSPDKKQWGLDVTDVQGQTVRIWLASTIKDTDSYVAEISLGPNLVYTYPQLKIQKDVAQEVKIVTKWPKIVDALVTVQVFKTPQTKVSQSDGKFLVEMRDSKKNKIAESEVDSKGDAHFSKFKVNNYAFFVLKQNSTTKEYKTLAGTKKALVGADTVKVYINNPELNSDHLNCNCVAFRLDDIQDFFLNNAQMEILRLFAQKNASLTIGIIAGVFGTDQKLVNLVTDGIHSNQYDLEAANHSWIHHDMTTMKKDAQKDDILKANQKIYDVLGTRPVTFIPPENLFNNDTINILQTNNFTHISYHASTTTPPPFKKSTFYHFPAVTQISMLQQQESFWQAQSVNKTFEGIQDGLFNYGYAVVMVNPHEFSTYIDGFYENKVNQTQLKQLGLLVDKVKAEGYKIVTIGDIENYDKIKTKTITPEKKTTKLPNCNCVAFRFDNIQDFYLNNVQNEVINTFQGKDVKLTISVIAKFFGDDAKTVGPIKEKLHKNSPKIAIASRGWEYVDHSQYTKEEQSASLKKTNDKLSKILGITSTIFVPPLNQFNNDTFSAMDENRMRFISSSTALDHPPYDLRNSIPFHVPYTITTSDMLDDDPFLTGTINEKAVTKIRKSLTQYGFAIVTMQTQDFAIKTDVYQNEVNQEKIQKMQSLIDYIKTSGLDIVTIDEIPKHSTSQKQPYWVDNLYSWYDQGLISRSDLLNAIKYLIGKEIIQFTYS